MRKPVAPAIPITLPFSFLHRASFLPREVTSRKGIFSAQRLRASDSPSGNLVPGFLANILIGAFAVFASWSFYGSGPGVELGIINEPRAVLSLKFSALAGAFLVGVAGAKWITNEVDK